jgi:hypothetical protein
MACFRRPFASTLLALLVLAVPASAQVPNAPPGTICVTPQSWCRAVQPGPPGGPCACRTANGWVQGVLR